MSIQASMRTVPVLKRTVSFGANNHKTETWAVDYSIYGRYHAGQEQETTANQINYRTDASFILTLSSGKVAKGTNRVRIDGADYDVVDVIKTERYEKIIVKAVKAP